MITLLVIWAVPSASFLLFLATIDTSHDQVAGWSYLGWLLGFPLAALLTVTVVPLVLVVQAVGARGRRRDEARRAADQG